MTTTSPHSLSANRTPSGIAEQAQPEPVFFSRKDHAGSNETRVTLFAWGADHPNAPKFEGYIGEEKVLLFLRQPVDRPPFLSIVGVRSGSRPNETLGTARVVTAPSGAPRLIMYLKFMGGRRAFASVSRQLDHQALLALGLDEQRQQAKRQAWLASKIEPVRLSGLSDLPGMAR